MSPLVKPVSLLSREANTSSIDIENASFQYLTITDAAQNGALDISGDHTIEWWWKPEDKTALSVEGVITKFGAQLSYAYRWSGDFLQGFISQNGTTYDFGRLNTSSWLATGTWHHIAITCDVSEPVASQWRCRSFTEGGSSTDRGVFSAVINVGVASIFNSNTNVAVLNDQFLADRCMDGLVDDFRIWSTVRSAPQIDAARNHQLAGNEPGLVAYWKFNNNANDSTSNSNDLTPVNGPTYSTDVPFT